MSVDQALFDLLAGDATIESLVAWGSPRRFGIYPEIVPQAVPDLPAVRYARISSTPSMTLDGPTGTMPIRYQVDCYASTPGACRQLADAVVARVHGYRGTVGAVTIQHAYVDDLGQFSEFEGDRADFRITLDVVVISTETRP